MQAQTEILLVHFGGDFAAHARVMTRVSSVSSVLGFFIKPLLAALTDVHGRKPLLLLSPVLQMVLKGGMAIAPSRLMVPLLFSQYLLGSFTYESMHLATDAATGDLYSDDPKRLGEMISQQVCSPSDHFKPSGLHRRARPWDMGRRSDALAVLRCPPPTPPSLCATDGDLAGLVHRLPHRRRLPREGMGPRGAFKRP
jgi:hypothetical protein